MDQTTRQIVVCPEENANETSAPCKTSLQLSHFILDTNLELFQFVSILGNTDIIIKSSISALSGNLLALLCGMLISKKPLKSSYNLLQWRPWLVYGYTAQDIWVLLPGLHSPLVTQRDYSMDYSLLNLVLSETLQLAAGLAGMQWVKNNRLGYVFATFRACLVRLAEALRLQPVTINIGLWLID